MKRKLPNLLANALIGRLTAKRLRALALDEAGESYIGEAELRDLIFHGITQIIDPEVAGHVLTSEELQTISEILEEFKLQFDNLPESAVLRFRKARLLIDLDQGRLPSKRPWPSLVLPERGEALMWVFNDVCYYIPRTRRSHGVRIRELVHEDTGELLIGSWNVYFAGPRRTLKLPLRKIIRLQVESGDLRADTAGDLSEESLLERIGLQSDNVCSRGRIQITRDGGNQYTFDCDDPKFPVDLISRLAAL
jgi:hypothetical protein